MSLMQMLQSSNASIPSIIKIFLCDYLPPSCLLHSETSSGNCEYPPMCPRRRTLNHTRDQTCATRLFVGHDCGVLGDPSGSRRNSHGPSDRNSHENSSGRAVWLAAVAPVASVAVTPWRMCTRYCPRTNGGLGWSDRWTCRKGAVSRPGAFAVCCHDFRRLVISGREFSGPLLPPFHSFSYSSTAELLTCLRQPVVVFLSLVNVFLLCWDAWTSGLWRSKTYLRLLLKTMSHKGGAWRY